MIILFMLLSVSYNMTSSVRHSGSIPYWDYAPGTVSVERSGSINVSGYAIVQNSIHFDSYERKD